MSRSADVWVGTVGGLHSPDAFIYFTFPSSFKHHLIYIPLVTFKHKTYLVRFRKSPVSLGFKQDWWKSCDPPLNPDL